MEKPRKLASGKYQARVFIDGRRVSLGAFDTIKAAQAAMMKAYAQAEAGEIVGGGKIKLEKYGLDLIESRQDLAVGSKRNYLYNFKNHIVPTFGHKSLKDVTPAAVRAWYMGMPATPKRKAVYTLLRSIFEQAVMDAEIPRNPCHIKGAGKDSATKRPDFTVAQVLMLRDMAGASTQLGTLIYFLLGSALRAGEALALNWEDIDLEAGVVTADKHLVKSVGLVDGTKHQPQGKRAITLPQGVTEALSALKASRNAMSTDPVFINTKGNRLLYASFNADFKALTTALGMEQMKAHDIRHVSLTMYAESGATMAEQMRRGGHNDHRSSLRYQHASLERDAEIAKRMAERFG